MDSRRFARLAELVGVEAIQDSRGSQHLALGGIRRSVAQKGTTKSMRAAVQRVANASVEVDGSVCGAIGRGLLVFVGVAPDDGNTDVTYLVDKVRHLRIFCDPAGKMNLDVLQAGGQVLAVSAFTVQADARKGRRPSFDTAAEPSKALELYEKFCTALTDSGIHVERGSFGDMMQVHSNNDGPICILLDSTRLF